jgi:hypothetical protein
VKQQRGERGIAIRSLRGNDLAVHPGMGYLRYQDPRASRGFMTAVSDGHSIGDLASRRIHPII